MNEVSALMARSVIELAAGAGLRVEALLEGLPFDRASIRRAKRVAWDDLGTFMERLEVACGGPEELEELVQTSFHTSLPPEALGVLRAFVSPKLLYRFLWEVIDPAMYTNLLMGSEELDGGAIRFSCRLNPVSRPCLAFFRGSVGALAGMACHLGLPPVRVDVEEITPRSLVAVAHLPASRASLREGRATSIASLRRATEWLIGALALDYRASSELAAETRDLVDRQAAQLADVGALGRELARHVDLLSLTDALVATLGKLGWTRVALSLVPIDAEEAVLVASSGEPEPILHTLSLETGGRHIGRLEVGGDGDVQLLDELAPWLSICLDNARTFEAMIERRSADAAGVAERVQEAGRELALTSRQAEVLARVVRGLSNKEIAAELRCAENTVEFHVTQLLRKSRAQGRTQLIAKFWARALRGAA